MSVLLTRHKHLYKIINPKPLAQYYYSFKPYDFKTTPIKIEEFQFHNYQNQRPYLIEVYQDQKKIIGERTLDIEGTINFRDMGGYQCKDGKTIKWGMLYRSDQLSKLTQEGIDYFNQLQIDAIVDYRSDDEISKYPNCIVKSETFHLDPKAQTAELSAQFSSSKDKENESLITTLQDMKKRGLLPDPHIGMYGQYENFVNQPESQNVFRQLLKLAAHPKYQVILQHCRGGKDRTGFGALLILGVLGVSKEDIITDYMLTYENRIERNNHKMNEYRQLCNDPEILDYLYALIETNPQFIETSYDLIIKNYDSIQNYAVQVLGVTTKEIEAIQKKYLV